MDSKDAYGIALKIADLYFKVLQFFIAICTLFGGWIVVKGLPDGTLERMLLAVIFLASTGTLLKGQLTLLKRADAAINLSEQRLEKSMGDVPPQVKPLFAVDATARGRLGTVIGMGGVILAILVLIFVAGDSTQKDGFANLWEIAS